MFFLTYFNFLLVVLYQHRIYFHRYRVQEEYKIMAHAYTQREKVHDNKPRNLTNACSVQPEMMPVMVVHTLVEHRNTRVHKRCVTPKALVKAFARKRAFDILFSLLVVILLLSWLTPVIALLIKLESKGPTFFKQLRTGKDGKLFYCLKFRSMAVNAAADVDQALKNDSRVTKLGSFLRKTSIDELPQFINVLKGEMSVVGPRPHMVLHTEKYSRTIHNFMDRHLVMPGITGLAQVSGYRGEIKQLDAMAKRVDADLEYIDKWSFWLDLRIMLLTIKKVVRPDEKAY